MYVPSGHHISRQWLIATVLITWVSFISFHFFSSVCARRFSQLTTGRPKPKKASGRKHAGGLLPETGGGIRALAPNKPPSRSATAQGATRIFVPVRIHQPSTHTPTTPSPVSTLSPIIKPDRPEPGISDRRSEQTSIGVTSTDSTAFSPKKKPSPFGLAGPDALPRVGRSLPSSPSQVPPSPAPPSRSPRRQSRIPSTGARALVMDVAQALQEAQAPPPPLPRTGAETTGERSSVVPRQGELHAVSPMEKRERSSAFVMERKPMTLLGVSPEAAVLQAKVVETAIAREVGRPDDDVPPGQRDNDGGFVVEIRE